MVTRKRIQGETVQILTCPERTGIVRVFAVFKGPNNVPPVSVEARRVSAVVGAPWMAGAGGWLGADYGPFFGTWSVWLITQDTSAFDVGQWGAEIWTVDGIGTKTVLTIGSFEITASLAAGGSNDTRSLAARTVDAIEMYMADPRNLKAASYKINDRELTRFSFSEIKAQLRYWNQKLKTENLRAAGVRRMGARISVHL